MTATGWTFEQLNESSAGDVVSLLEYWGDEPPAHVTLALRYLGQRKRGRKLVTEQQARQQNAEIAAMPGITAAVPLPAHLKEMMRGVEEMKAKHKGL